MSNVPRTVITVSGSTIIAIMSMWNNAVFGEPSKPDLAQIDGLRSERKIKINGQRHHFYDYALMDGSIWTTESPLVGDEKPRDLRPWEQRSLKNKIAFNVWNYGVRPLAQISVPVVVPLFR